MEDVHPLKDFFVLLIGVSTATLVGFFILGLLVDWVVDSLPEDVDEAPFFRQAYETSDSEEVKTLQQMVDALSQCAKVDFAVSVGIVDQEDVNAVALPGKQILVFQGLLDVVESDIGLAFVLAHELAHFKHKDHLRGLGRGIVLGGLSVLLTGTNSALTEALMPAAQIGESQYSRSRESAADKAALETIKCHYGRVDGASELFEYLHEHHSTLLSFSHYLASHPDSAERIQNLKKWSLQVNQPK